MPCHYQLDAGRRVVLSVFEGEVSPEELLTRQREIHREPWFDPDMNHLMDLRRLDPKSATFDLLAEMAKRAPKSSRRRFAFLVRSGAQRGLARQFGGLVGLSEEQHRLFEDLAEARAWLEPEEAER